MLPIIAGLVGRGLATVGMSAVERGVIGGALGSAMKKSANDNNRESANDNHKGPIAANDNNPGPIAFNDNNAKPPAAVPNLRKSTVSTMMQTSTGTEQLSSKLDNISRGDGVDQGAIVSTLAPILESIDRNTTRINMAVEEICLKLDAMQDDDSIDDLRRAEYIAENSKHSSSSYGSSLSRAEAAPEKSGLLSALMLALGGGLTQGIGSVIAGPDNDARVDTPSGAPNVNRPVQDSTGRTRKYRKTSEPVTGDFTNRERRLLEIISQNEGAGYNDVFAYGKYGNSDKKLTDMNINEIIELQKKIRKNTKKAGIGKINGRVVGTSAVGKGQFVEGTLKATLKSMGYNESTWGSLKYSAELQDRLILQNARNSGFDPNDPRTLENQRRVGNQWESLARHKMSRSKYQASVLDPLYASNTQRRNIQGSKTGHWDQLFNPMDNIKAKYGNGSRLNSVGGPGNDSILVSVPNGMDHGKFMGELSTMFPGANIRESKNKNGILLTFNGWHRASDIAKGRIVSPKNGSNLNRASAQNAAAKQAVNVNVHAPTTNNNMNGGKPQAAQKRKPPTAKPSSNGLLSYFGL